MTQNSVGVVLENAFNCKKISRYNKVKLYFTHYVTRQCCYNKNNTSK